jgi:hypothetical protein
MKVSHLFTAAVIAFFLTSAAAQDAVTDNNQGTTDTKEISTEIKNADAGTKDAVADAKKAKAEAKKAAAEKKAKNDNPPKTLLQIKDSRFSGYGGISTSYTRIGDTNSCLVGGRGGVIINDKTVFGFGGMGLVYPTDREELTGSEYNGVFDKASFGYGGFLAEYYFNPKDLIVFSAGTIIGGGGLLFYDNDANDDEEDDYDYNYDNFFVIEPELHVYVNVTRFCRIGIGASYRFTEGIDSGVLKDKDFRGPSASAMVQFGWF